MRTAVLLVVASLTPALASAQDRRPAPDRERARIIERAETLRPSVRMILQDRAPRAVLGVTLAPDAGRSDTAGVRVDAVTENGPAARAGIRAGSLLQAVDGVDLRVSAADAGDPMLGGLSARRLTRTLAEKRPGDEVALRVRDGNETRAVRVRLADPDSLYAATRPAMARGAGVLGRTALRGDRASLGVQLGSTGSRRDTLGVLVIGVDDEGPAARAGIFEGARIAAIDGTDLRVPSPDAADPMVASSRVQRLTRALADVEAGREVELRVWQNNAYRTVRVRTVRADSLPQRRSTFIIGDGAFGAPGLSPDARVRIERMVPSVRERVSPPEVVRVVPPRRIY